MTYLSLYKIAYRDALMLRMRDLYSLHRVVWDLFPLDPNRKEKNRILFADKGFRRGIRSILIQSGIPPRIKEFGSLETKPIPQHFLEQAIYRFEIIVNATKRIRSTGKLMPVRGRPAVADWFKKKSDSWGFESFNLEVEETDVVEFAKAGHQLTINQARILGVLKVRDRNSFIHSFTYGIGRGRAFGCGLLQLVPAASSTL